MRLLTFASPQAAEYGKPEDTERRVGGRSGATRDGNRKTHRGLQGKQEGLLGHYFSPAIAHGALSSKAGFCAGFVHSIGVEVHAAFPQPSDPVREPRHRVRILVAEPVVRGRSGGPGVAREI